MKIYLLRHGESVAIGSDNERPLSEKGKKDIKKLSELLSPIGIHVDKIFHSGKMRAQQTAEIVASVVSHDALKIHPALDPLNEIDAIVTEINYSQKDLMFVSHMPFLGKLLNYLVTGHEDNNIVVFKAGTLICLEKLESERWLINWMISPVLFA